MVRVPTFATPRRKRALAGGLVAGALSLGIAGAAMAGGLSADDAEPAAVRTQKPAPTEPAAPGSDGDTSATATGERVGKFYEDYLKALDGSSAEPGELRKEYLSAHYRDDLAYEKKKEPRSGDGVLQAEHVPEKIGGVSHDNTIDRHSWFTVELEWEGGKVPAEEAGEPGEKEYAPTGLRVQVDRDTQRISDVSVEKNEPGPGQPENPNS